MTQLPFWLQNYVERHTATAINEQVEERSRDVDFLRNDAKASPAAAALFTRREIQRGNLLGQGNFSDVYEISRMKLLKTGHSPAVEEARLSLCWKAKKGVKYAIKVPKKPGRREFYGSSRGRSDNNCSSCAQQRFPEYTKASIDLILEGKFLSGLNHKNIIKVRGLSSGPSPFIIMDRLEDTLDQRIRRWRLERDEDLVVDSRALLREKANYAMQMAEAVEYLHERRLIMRDIKPANVGFKKDPKTGRQDLVQLFDFGLCRELPPIQEASSREDDEAVFRMSMAGTLRYMAVEVINTGFYGLKADVYSWAVVCFEMMTLEVPFASVCASPGMHRRFVCREGERPSFPTAAEVPSCLQELIQNSWAQETSERMDMATVSAQLRTMIDEDFSETTSSSKSSPLHQSTIAPLPTAISPLLSEVSPARTNNKRPSLASTGSFAHTAAKRRPSSSPPFLL